MIGGLIGLAVDAISGGLYKLTPEQMTATLGKQASGLKDGAMDIHIVLRPDPSWERIGQLAR